MIAIGVNLIFSFSDASENHLSSIETILNNYKKQIVNLDDLDQDAREYFINHERSKRPGVVVADFNGDGSEDVAILTKGALLIFMCNKSCREVKTISYGGFTGIQYVIPASKGELIEETDAMPSKSAPVKVRLKNVGVHLDHYGKGIIVYYWDEQKNDFIGINTIE